MTLFAIAALVSGRRVSASVVTTTITGTVGAGSTDVTGVFGVPAGTNLAGQSFTLTFTFDDTKGLQGCNGLYVNCISQIYGSNTTTNPGTAVLQIASGSYTFGTLGVNTQSTNPLSSFTTLAGQASSNCTTSINCLVYFVQDFRSTSDLDYIAGTVLPANGSSFPITNWEGSFSAAGITTPAQGFPFGIGVTGPQVALGYLLPTSITVSGPPPASSTGTGSLPIVLTQPLTYTGLRVTKGQLINVTASGTMNWFTGSCGQACVTTPDGAACPYTGFYAQGLACWALIGQIGDGAPFKVGSSLQNFAAPESGDLYLGVNDTNYPDNTGSWTAQVSIQNANGAGANPLQFVPIAPCRVVDTRGAAGTFGGPELGASSTREFDIPQQPNCGIPSTAVAYSLNVTVVPDATLQYLTMWPSGELQPNVSTLNSYDGRVKANAAIVPAGTNGGVNVFTSDASQVILDIDGYFVPAGTAGALAYYPVTPCRLVDTRGVMDLLGGPFLSGLTSRAFPLLNNTVCGIPPTAQAYSLNVTTVPHKTLNYLTTWPTGEPQPNVSTLNSPTGAIAANAAFVPAGANGEVSVFVSDDADVILDVNGYFAAPSSGSLSLYTATPCRVLDTRSSSGAFNGVLKVDIEGSMCAPPSTARAYVLNATVVPPGQLGYLTMWPDGEAQPNVSTLNAGDAAITSNLAIVPTQNGTIDAFSSDATQLILDLSSYFAP